jgi:hypothetical protein
MTYSDEHLERWGEIFTANPCIRRFCTFEQFIARPYRICAALAGDTLLPRQRELQQRLDAAERQA